MRFKFLVLALILIHCFGFSQFKKDSILVDNINKEINKIDEDKKIKTYHFIVKKNKRTVFYEYLKKDNTIVKISRKWIEIIGNQKETSEDYFYLKNNKRIFALESILDENIKDKDGVITWNCSFWIENNKVIDMISLGHGKTELDDWDYEKELNENFEYMMKIVKAEDKKQHSKKDK